MSVVRKRFIGYFTQPMDLGRRPVLKAIGTGMAVGSIAIGSAGASPPPRQTEKG